MSKSQQSQNDDQTQTYLIGKGCTASSFFQGYCFVDSDLVFGAQGATDYFCKNGNEVSFGQDGCYVLMKKIGTRTLIGGDYSGFKKIFYYHVGNDWAVSNSILLLLERMRRTGLLPTLNGMRSKLASRRTPFTDQVYSHNTAVEEIKLLPVGFVLEIGFDSLKTSRLPSYKMSADYSTAFSKALETWVARIETMLSDKRFVVRSDLTGGMDSRATMAILYAANKRLGSGCIGNLVFSCGFKKNTDPDIRVAENLANIYGLSLNQAISPKSLGLANSDAYEIWKSLCPGAYSPVYFPATRPDAFDVRITGAGGENHRPFFRTLGGRNLDYAKFVKRVAKKSNLSRAERRQFKKEMRDLLDFFEMTHPQSKIDPLILHYREFRNRFHSGRMSQYRHSYPILASQLFDDAMRHATPEMVNDGQLHYDIMESLSEGLTAVPFDSKDKAPTERVLGRLTRVSLSASPNPGKVFCAEFEHPENGNKNQTLTPLAMLCDDFGRWAQSMEIGQIFGFHELQKLQNVLQEARTKGMLDHAGDANMASAVILAGECLSCCSANQFQPQGQRKSLSKRLLGAVRHSSEWVQKLRQGRWGK